MKNQIPVFVILSLLLSACGSFGASAKPTPIVVPTAVPEIVSTNEPLPVESGKPGSERVAPGDGMVQVFVPAGEFEMGGYDDDAQSDEKPTHKVQVDAFWIDKLEVTNGMYQLCVTDGACQPPRQTKSATQDSYFANKAFADFPVIFVNWQDATNYCNWAGRRLPTEAEWEYAARGNADTRRFPWGDKSPDNTLANYDYQQLRDTTKVGSFPKGASPFGALDMAGNVWEWVSDFYSGNFYNLPGSLEPNPVGVEGKDGGSKSLRGGSYADIFKELRVSNRGFANAPDLTADSKSEAYQGAANERTGFRCTASGN